MSVYVLLYRDPWDPTDEKEIVGVYESREGAMASRPHLTWDGNEGWDIAPNGIKSRECWIEKHPWHPAPTKVSR